MSRNDVNIFYEKKLFAKNKTSAKQKCSTDKYVPAPRMQ